MAPKNWETRHGLGGLVRSLEWEGQAPFPLGKGTLVPGPFWRPLGRFSGRGSLEWRVRDQ